MASVWFQGVAGRAMRTCASAQGWMGVQEPPRRGVSDRMRQLLSSKLQCLFRVGKEAVGKFMPLLEPCFRC